MTWERGQLLKRETGRICPLKYEGEPVCWREIAEWISDEEGQRIPWQTVRNTFINTTVRQLKEKLESIPEVRDWLLERGIDPTKDD